MHHTDSEISKTISFLPPGKASKGNVLLVCEIKRLSGVRSDAAVHSAARRYICLLQFQNRSNYPAHLHTFLNIYSTCGFCECYGPS